MLLAAECQLALLRVLEIQIGQWSPEVLNLQQSLELRKAFPLQTQGLTHNGVEDIFEPGESVASLRIAGNYEASI
jgi:hypothetical protein